MAYGCEFFQSEQDSIALGAAQTPLLIALLHTVQRSTNKGLSIPESVDGLNLFRFLMTFLRNQTNACLLMMDLKFIRFSMRNQAHIHWILKTTHIHFDDTDAAEQLAYELTYSVQQHPIELPKTLSYHRPISEVDRKQIQKTIINKQIRPNTLSEISPLSHGLIERYISLRTTLNFIPSSWIEQQKQCNIHKRLRKCVINHRCHMASSFYSLLHDLWCA